VLIEVRPDGTLLYIADGNRGTSIEPYNRVRRLTLP
jgi:hypothetical protein